MTPRDLRKSTLLALTVVLLLLAAHTSASADSYSIVPIGPANTIFEPLALNNAGQIVGRYARYTQPGVFPQHRPFLYSNGVLRDLGSFGGIYSSANAINNAGVVVGESNSVVNDFGGNRAFLYRDGQLQNLGTFGQENSFALDINDAGQIVGGTNSRDLGQRAFLLDGDRVRFIDVPPSIRGYASAQAVAINNAGQIAVYGFGRAYLYDINSGSLRDVGTLGSYANVLDLNDAGQAVGYSALTPEDVDEEDEIVHAFIYENGVMKDIDTWGSVYSEAVAINNLGQVVGGALLPDGSEANFLYSDGEMRELESLLAPDAGWDIQIVRDINDRGQIIGQGYFGGQYSAFVMTPNDVEPVPEPATMLLLGTGLAGVGAAVGKRRRAGKGEES